MVDPSNAIIVTALIAKPRSKKRPPAMIQRGTARSGKGEPEGSADKSVLVIYLGCFSAIPLPYRLCHTFPKLVRLRLKTAFDSHSRCPLLTPTADVAPLRAWRFVVDGLDAALPQSLDVVLHALDRFVRVPPANLSSRPLRVAAGASDTPSSDYPGISYLSD